MRAGTYCTILLGDKLRQWVANRSVAAAFAQTVSRIAGKAQLQLTAGDAGFTEEVLEKVQSLRQVSAAAPVIEATVSTGEGGKERLLILAVDMTGDQNLRSYEFDDDAEMVDDPLVFLAQPDSLIVTRAFAARNRLVRGSQLQVQSMDGLKLFTIRGILRPGGVAQAYGGNLGIMDIYAAQKVFGRGRRFDRIDIAVAPGVSVQQAQAVLQRVLGPGVDVVPPATRGKQFEDLLGIYSLTSGISSGFAVFIGLFIIYNSFSIAVTQRRAEIGILRALGATRGQIRALFLLESAVAGVIGSVVGIALGVWLGGSLSRAMSAMMGDFTGLYALPVEVAAERGFLGLALVVGVLCSMIAAWVPASNAAGIEPVRALQKGSYQALSSGENRWRVRGGFVALLLALVAMPLSSREGLFYFGFLMTVVAVLLYSPALSTRVARLLRGALMWLRPVEGGLAADSLIQSPRRTSATVTALILALALVVGQGGATRAIYASIREWTAAMLTPDIFVSTSQTLVSRDFRFPITMRPELEAVEGVAEVQPVRTVRMPFRGSSATIVVAEVEREGARVHRRLVAGDLHTADRLVSQEKAVLISDNLAQLHHLQLNDTVELAAPGGVLRLPVAGIIRDYTTQTGSIFLERSAYVRLWGDASVDVFRVYLKPGASAVRAKDSINQRLAGQVRAVVLLNAEVKRYVEGVVGQWFRMTYIQVVLAVLVAVLGIANTLTISIRDRRRELGVLRAVGALRAQVRATLWLEALTIGLIGLMVGFALGSLQLYYILEMVHRSSIALSLDYSFPIGIALILIPAILGAAILSAAIPAEKAVRGSLAEALENE